MALYTEEVRRKVETLSWFKAAFNQRSCKTNAYNCCEILIHNTIPARNHVIANHFIFKIDNTHVMKRKTHNRILDDHLDREWRKRQPTSS